MPDGATPTAYDAAVWCAGKLGVDFYGVHQAFGMTGPDGNLVAAAVLHNRTKYAMELSYYGPGTMRAGMYREFAKSALDAGMLTLTMTVRSRKIARHLTRIGCKYVGAIPDMYGAGKDALIYAATAPLLLKLSRRA